jgi:hypothetical protein
MSQGITVGDRLTGAFARVRGVASTGPVGTGALLWTLAYEKEVAPILDAFDITRRVVFAVLATPGRPAAEPEAAVLPLADTEWAGGSPADFAQVRGTDDRAVPVTARVAAALGRVTGDSPLALLAALLEDGACEAYAVIRDCGVDPEEVRRSALDGRARQLPDRLPPALRPARDALIGRTRYRGRGLRDRLLFSVLAREVNHAERPVLWARLEADERAREQNRATRTDDVLLALLVTHEVLAAYPHLAAGARQHYGAAEDLLSRGVDHQRVRAVELDDRWDAVPPATILKPGPDWTDDTRLMLERLTAHPDNRATRLLAAIGA